MKASHDAYDRADRLLGAGLVIIGGHRSWRGPFAATVSLFGWFVALRGTSPPTAVESGEVTEISLSVMAFLRRCAHGSQ